MYVCACACACAQLLFQSPNLLGYNLFWQSCFYVPPSLRPRAAITRTPASGLSFILRCCWFHKDDCQKHFQVFFTSRILHAHNYSLTCT